MRMRSGVSSVEILIAVALLTAAFIPVYSLVQGNSQSAFMNEMHVLARRRAMRVHAYLAGHPFWRLAKRSESGSPPPSGVPGLPEEGLEIDVPILSGASEALLLDAPDGLLDMYVARVDKMEVRAYFHEFPDEPGLARISVHVKWKTDNKDRFFVSSRFLEDPFHWRQ